MLAEDDTPSRFKRLFHKRPAKAKKQERPTLKRQANETLKEFYNRVDSTMAAATAECAQQSRRVSEKRKNYLKERKKNKKKSVSEDIDDFIRVEKIPFGTVADAPPILTKPKAKTVIEIEREKVIQNYRKAKETKRQRILLNKK